MDEKKYELAVFTDGSCWLYYKTNCDNAKDAFRKFSALCGRTGINIDNLNYTELVLRRMPEMTDVDRIVER